MKIYRNSPWTDEGSLGFRWFATKKEALEEAERNPKEYDALDLSEIAREFSVPPTKSGLLALLEKAASHPDNG